ncbi:MAG: polysaccharide deacetylase family protein [Bdellovibrionales bacterium]|nr:polysaccharide deacetylase family protein [Bdellovibrionales bacterium]
MPNESSATGKQRTPKGLLRQAAANALHYSGLVRFLGGETPWRILMYHRIIDPREVAYPLQPGMYVKPETFARQIEYLAAEARVIPLEVLLEEITSGAEIPKRTVVITFDDGWEDNYRTALPLLERHQLPATVFLATSFVGTARAYWSDEIAQALHLLGQERKFIPTVCTRLEESEIINDAAAQKVRRMLEVPTGASSSEALDDLVEFLKKLPYEERRQAVNTILTLAKEFTSTPLSRSFVTWEEVHDMAARGISFGNHSHHHQPLVELTEARVKDEIDHALQEFRAHSIEPVSAFCYPRGAYNDMTQAALSDKGIAFALTTEREDNLAARPALLGRIGIHEDIASTVPLFSSRIWVSNTF